MTEHGFRLRICVNYVMSFGVWRKQSSKCVRWSFCSIRAVCALQMWYRWIADSLIAASGFHTCPCSRGAHGYRWIVIVQAKHGLMFLLLPRTLWRLQPYKSGWFSTDLDLRNIMLSLLFLWNRTRTFVLKISWTLFWIRRKYCNWMMMKDLELSTC